jgi:hypothetical protein
MIPASYLYKQAYDQHWGEDFARSTGEAPWEAEPNAGLWEKPALWRAIAGIAGRLFGHDRRSGADETEASGRTGPEATSHQPAFPA